MHKYTKVNYHIANALIKNNNTLLNKSDIESIFNGKPYEGFMFQNYSNVYFFLQECRELDLYKQNIEQFESDEKKPMAYALMRRAMIRKMPYSRLTLNWYKIVQLRDKEYSYKKYKRRRAYHNQSFKHHFLQNLDEYNLAVFNNNKENIAYNDNVFNLLDKVKPDIINLDIPYKGTMNNYFGFYGLLDDFITSEVAKPFDNNFVSCSIAMQLFDKLFSKLNNFKYWYLNYNNSSYPSKNELLYLLGKYSDNVEVTERKHNYQITGKDKKAKNKEFMFIIKNKAHGLNRCYRKRQADCETAN